ncbi:hypothetical protein [Psychrobacillus sp. FSL K6-2843]|uniref:hypothetical protein n=1 Tax=Psychrobacillus sp. FSL K6-2843 TaxID=2921549 RepID=UPI0011A27562|nr:hypothetical protein GI482_09410 [Bacillus sp. N3536]
MKYEITFKEYERSIEVEVPHAISAVAILLMGDVQSNSQPWLKLINKVLRGESNYEECTGNNCTLEINQDITKILDNFSEEEDECIIETNELVKIIELWTEKINSTVE